MTNTVKHAEATEVLIQISKKGKSLDMLLKDNGKGINNSSQASTGQGLENMEMRAGKINGQLEFLKENGFGIHLKVNVF